MLEVVNDWNMRLHGSHVRRTLLLLRHEEGRVGILHGEESTEEGCDALVAQFDNLSLGDWAFGWHPFAYKDFIAEPGEGDHLDSEGNYWRVVMPPRKLFSVFPR